MATRIYRASPIVVQNLIFTAVGYRNHRQRFNKHFRAYLDFLRESQWWDKESIQSYQVKRLKVVLKEAYHSSPFVKKQLDSVGAGPGDIYEMNDLRKIPLSNKDLLLDSGVPYHNQDIAKSKFLKDLTSGTSGRSLTLYKTREVWGKQWAVWTRLKERVGIFLGDKHLSFGARVPIDARQSAPPYWRKNYITNQVYLSTFHFSEKFLPDIVKYINSEQFDYFVGYPSSMYLLAKFMEERGITLPKPPKYIVGGSDALLPHFEKTISSVFRAPVTEQYGMGEACGNFSKCEHGRFHLDFEFGIVELLDIPGEPNQKLKKLVFTGLENEAMPLVRYDVGDYVEVDDSDCPCGRQSLTVKSIQGRLEDYVVTPDGRKVSGMNQVFEWIPAVREIQVVQSNPESIVVNYVPTKDFELTNLNALEIEFRKRLGDRIRIEYTCVSEIPKTKGGKYKAVVSEVGSML